MLLATEQWLLRVLSRNGHEGIFQVHIVSASCQRADVTQVVSPVRLYRLDLDLIVRSDPLLPLEPPLPAIGHAVGQFHLHPPAPAPMPSPPIGRVKATKVRSPPLPQMLWKGP